MTDIEEPEESKGRIDPLDAVAIATKAWNKATRAVAERAERDRKIIAAFDSGATGREVAAASGLELEEVYRVHQRADQVKAYAQLERMAEAARETPSLWISNPGSGRFEQSMREVLSRMPTDAEVIRGIAPEYADTMMAFYAKHRATYGL